MPASWCCPELVKGANGPWLSIGGGNAAGKFSQIRLSKIIKDMNLIPQARYSGVVFDIEAVDGASSTMVPLFR